MDLTDISYLRLMNQQVLKPQFGSAKEIVGWMGAMQAQDFSMSKWAIGLRLPGSTEALVEKAINEGDIIRTHLLRPTWHLVSSADIYWLLDLTAPQIKTAMRSRDKELGLDTAVYNRSRALIEKALIGGKHLLRDELVAVLRGAGLSVNDNRASHLLMRAELDGVICSGSLRGNKQTYALLGERVPTKRLLNREEALAQLARRYFNSHCPATLHDFSWWSGLSASDSRQALTLVKHEFVSETLGEQTYWLSPRVDLPPSIDNDLVCLLPAFDEFIISYKNRTASLPFEHHNKTVSNNGIFRPTIVVNGQVFGVWKRTLKGDRVLVETLFFCMPDKRVRDRVCEAAQDFGHFVNKKVEVV